jgi:putative Ca2+/H+ antiporter (TMEM165/GDT1 family)
VNLALLGLAFAVVFVAELADKTALASLLLGVRYRAGAVFCGVAVAFSLHVLIAVAAGSALSLAPRRLIEAVVAVLFLAGAALLLRRARREGVPPHTPARVAEPVAPTQPPAPSPANPAPSPAYPAPEVGVRLLARVRLGGVAAGGFWRVAATSFAALFVAEFGDLTQIATANLAARYQDPLTVGIGALLGLWMVAALAILGGRQLLRWVPLRWLTHAAALVMAVLGVLSGLHAITG